MSDYRLHAQLYASLDDIIKGKLASPINKEPSLPYPNDKLVDKFNQCLEYINELYLLTLSVSRGELEDSTETDSKNLLAGPARELKKQMQTLAKAISSILEGENVRELYYPGKLFDDFNSLTKQLNSSLPQSTYTNEDDQKHAQRLTRRSLELLKVIVIECDSKGEILFMTENAKYAIDCEKALPYGSDEGITNPLTAYLCTFACYSSSDFLKLKGVFPVVKELYFKQSGLCYKIASDIVIQKGGDLGIVHVIDEISDFSFARQMNQYGVIDSVSTAYTRSSGLQKLNEIFVHRGEINTCVAFIKLDDLAAIESHFGTTEAEFAIKKAAQILISCVRDDDWVIRYEHDTFLIIINRCNKDLAELLINRMRYISQKVSIDYEKPYRIEFSSATANISKAIKDLNFLLDLLSKRLVVSSKKKLKPQ
jgi:diguanylate cyclase (GGDEF)-like protein